MQRQIREKRPKGRNLSVCCKGAWRFLEWVTVSVTPPFFMEFSNSKIKIMVVDDHAILRQGLVSLLEEYPEFEVVGQATNGKEALLFLEDHQPDVIILDVDMPLMNGRETLISINKMFPEIKVVMLTMLKGVGYETDYMELGAHSFLSKGADIDEITTAIGLVNKGGYYYSSHAQQLHIAAICDKHLQLSLTDREREIAKLICNNKTNKLISELLGISVNTIRFHRKKISKKTRTSSIIDLVKYCVRNGIITFD